MAKKSKRLISKKTKKKVKAAVPWAIAAATTGGMLAAVFERGFFGKVRAAAASSVDEVSKIGKSHGMSNGMTNGIIPQESGAV